MLVLGRKVDESIIIQTSVGEIKVMIVDIRRDSVQIGFECDSSIIVDREEIYLDKKKDADAQNSV